MLGIGSLKICYLLYAQGSQSCFFKNPQHSTFKKGFGSLFKVEIGDMQKINAIIAKLD